MNKTLTVLCLSAFFLGANSSWADDYQEYNDFKFPKVNDYPVVVKEAANASDFLPAHWHVMGKAVGDLNADKLNDTVLVVQGVDAKWKQKANSLGTSSFDTNPRLMLILFCKPDGKGFTLAKSTSNFVGCADSPSMDEPFDEIRIKNGVLEIQVQCFMNAGGWSASNTTYKFQNRDGKFVLIGADNSDRQRNTGETTDYSYNFLTGKIKIVKGNFQDDLHKKVLWKTIAGKQLRNLEQFKKLYEWQVVPDCYL